jgi:hypothetical protein
LFAQTILGKQVCKKIGLSKKQPSRDFESKKYMLSISVLSAQLYITVKLFKGHIGHSTLSVQSHPWT